MYKIMTGDYVDRNSGSYRFPGRVLSVYENGTEVMADVKLAGFDLIHIFNIKMLDKIPMQDFYKVDEAVRKVLRSL